MATNQRKNSSTAKDPRTPDHRENPTNLSLYLVSLASVCFSCRNISPSRAPLLLLHLTLLKGAFIIVLGWDGFCVWLLFEENLRSSVMGLYSLVLFINIFSLNKQRATVGFFFFALLVTVLFERMKHLGDIGICFMVLNLCLF